jgi:16S rRNA (cytosine967-C5)-methyltransferase
MVCPRLTLNVNRRGARVDAARRVAFDALSAVDERDAYANLVLPGLIRRRALSRRDAAFAIGLANGTLRLRGTYDAVLAWCLNRDIETVEPPVLRVLRLGSHQILSMRVPAHAAVSTSVDLVREAVGERAVGLVNAVLRRVADDDLAGWLDRLTQQAGELASLTVRHSHPDWIVREFETALKGDRQQLEAVLAADNMPPAVTLVARPGRSTVTELTEAGGVAGRWSPYAVHLPGGDPGAVAAVAEGRAGVQDEGSQLVALALAAARVDGDDLRWLDLCAGPGGKAALLAALAGQRSAGLVAVDRQERRARLVQANLGARRGLGAAGALGVVVADGTRQAWPVATFDRVLADVPCTGLGALRRRPEARWRREPGDVPALVRLQQALLRAAAESARPGGVVGYATCSPLPAETRHVVESVLQTCPDLVEEDARTLLPDVPDLGPGPHLQLWPHLHGTDAMFLSVLRRTAV